MCGQVENVYGPVNFGGNLPLGKFNFRKFFIPAFYPFSPPPAYVSYTNPRKSDIAKVSI